MGKPEPIGPKVRGKSALARALGVEVSAVAYKEKLGHISRGPDGMWDVEAIKSVWQVAPRLGTKLGDARLNAQAAATSSNGHEGPPASADAAAAELRFRNARAE